MTLNAVALIFGCILLCLALNYTFPLHRENLKLSSNLDSESEYANNSWHWDNLLHRSSIVERSKKMASDIENALKKIKYSAQDNGKNIHNESGVKKQSNKLSEEDWRQYEQLVIMKKYPYLDLKELENKYSPLTNKNTRQSLRVEPESSLRMDLGFSELDEGLNVEIINRGLTGFSIPLKSPKSVNMVENKSKDNLKGNEDKLDNPVKLLKDSSKRQVLGSLEKDILEYELKKNKIGKN